RSGAVPSSAARAWRGAARMKRLAFAFAFLLALNAAAWAQSGATVKIGPSSNPADVLTPVVSGSAGNNLVIKNAAGNLYAAYASTPRATAVSLVVPIAPSAPVDGSITPPSRAPLPANGSASINWAPGPGARFSTGVTAVVTSATTCFTKTIGVITAFIG